MIRCWSSWCISRTVFYRVSKLFLCCVIRLCVVLVKSIQVLRHSFSECCWSTWFSLKYEYNNSEVFDGSDKESWCFTLIIRSVSLLFCLIGWILRLGVLNELCSFMQQMLHVNCNCFLARLCFKFNNHFYELTIHRQHCSVLVTNFMFLGMPFNALSVVRNTALGK